ncbi:MAG: amino acid ABC transporter permease, partial [Rhizobiales bacterium]|nr:amino acid ABC transporter permease [Hyphomicrobiales bacterium]
LVGVYVEVIRNTPLLVQLYFFFFSLPLMGLRLSSDQAAILALSIHLGAYATEILRAGVEAAKSLGLSRWQIIRFVVIVPALRAVYPSLTSQFVLQLLGTSIVSAIAAEELTAIANNMAMQTFRNFEIYIVIAVIYFVLVQACSLVFRLLSRILFRWKA